MSLINDMLKDLETRTSGQGEEDLRRLVSGELRAVRFPARRVRPLFLFGLLALAGALAFVQRDRLGHRWDRPAAAAAASGPAVVQGAAERPAVPVPARDAPRSLSRSAFTEGPLDGGQPGRPPAAAVRAVAPASADPTAGTPPVPKVVKRPAHGNPALAAEALYGRGSAALAAGRRAEAVRALQEALRISPWHVEARQLLARELIRAGRPAAARDLLEAGLQRVPGHLPFALALARLHVSRGDDRAALAVLERQRRRAGKAPDYLGFLAAVYQRLGRHDEAVAAYRAALEARPGEARWWAGLAISLEQLRRWREARDAYRRAGHSGPLEPKLARYLASRLAALEHSTAR